MTEKDSMVFSWNFLVLNACQVCTIRLGGTGYDFTIIGMMGVNQIVVFNRYNRTWHS